MNQNQPSGTKLENAEPLTISRHQAGQRNPRIPAILSWDQTRKSCTLYSCWHQIQRPQIPIVLFTDKPHKSRVLYLQSTTDTKPTNLKRYRQGLNSLILSPTPSVNTKTKKQFRVFLPATKLEDSVLLLLLPDPFRGMGAWRKTMEPQKPGNSPWSGPQVVEHARAAFAKRKRAICPHHQIVRWKRVKVSENRTLARKKMIIAGAWRGKAGLHEGRFHGKETRASKENLPR